MSCETFPVGKYRISSYLDSELGLNNKSPFPQLKQVKKLSPLEEKLNNINTSPERNSQPSIIRLQWSDLRYTINEYRWARNGCTLTRECHVKDILQSQSGELAAGTITALMGPSGAGKPYVLSFNVLMYLSSPGKSTLLSCITGRYVKGMTGNITVRYPADRRSVTIAYVPQRDYLFPQFTVRETLVFASKMKNRGKDHEIEAMKVIQALNLESCADVKIEGCSGGEIKRVSIGVELISGPNILVLDEPTSGLDSSNAIKCVRLLRDLAGRGVDAPAIVVTIHQPNHRIFTDFHRIYLLSRHGQNIYFGPPQGLVDYFNNHSMKQPEFSSPADYAIEVASGSYGTTVFEALSLEQKKQREFEFEQYENQISQTTQKVVTVPVHKVISRMQRKRSKRSVYQTGLLTLRSVEASCFKSKQLVFKILVNIVIAILISLLWSEPTGTEDGCWQSTDFREDLLSGNFKASAREAYMNKISRITANCNLLFSTCVYLILVYSIGTVLVIPMEINTVSKEMSNSWYSVTSYFTAKTTADIPAVLMSIFSLEIVCWIATRQDPSVWRFASAYGLSVLMGIICESMGVLIGIVLSNDLVNATLMTMASSFPVLMFGGFLIKIADIPWYFQPMTYISYTRYTFEGILATVYGFGRCKVGAIDSVDFMQELSSAQNPFELITTVWHTFNVSVNDAARFAPVIGVPQSHLEEVLNGTVDYLGLNEPDSDHRASHVTPSTLSSSASYVMSYFKLEDDTLYRSFISLTLIVLAIKIIIYYLLAYRTRRTH